MYKVNYIQSKILKHNVFVFLSHSEGDFGPDFNNPQLRETYGYLPYVRWDDAAKERVQREMDEATHYEQYCIETGGSLVGDYSDLVFIVYILVSAAAV